MAEPASPPPEPVPAPRARGLRLWPAWIILALTAIALGVVRSEAMQEWLLRERPHLTTAIFTAAVLMVSGILLLAWWVLLSRARWPWRVAVIGTVGAFLALFRHSGMSGDLMPTFEFRWARPAPAALAAASPAAPAPAPAGTNTPPTASPRPDFPQFMGPDRTGILPDIGLATDWSANPPKVLWRRPVGSGWSGFAVVGNRAVTQEQVGDEEWVTCYALATGEPLWRHTYPGRFVNPIAGDGPRATPTVTDGRVFTLGAGGRLECVDLETGKPLWSRSLVDDFGASLPEWGFAGSPLLVDGRVVVNAGGSPGKALVALEAGTGATAWTAGDNEVAYGSPGIHQVAGVRQIVLFHHRTIAAHDPSDGHILWRQPFGTHYPLVAMPMQVDDHRLLFSAGYNVGTELLEIRRDADGTLSPASVWKSRKLKAKFANPYIRDGFVYGLDDGILVCLDLKDGSQRWKEGRYGHGQGLRLGEHCLMLAETGELVLLRPTPDGPNELGRIRVFGAKTWNPPALVGDLLLVRNDREAALLQLPLR